MDPSKKNVEDIYPLSPMQQGMLFHSLLAPGSEEYVVQRRYTLHGDLHHDAFKHSWQLLIDRHPILRTHFVWERRGEPLQIVRRQVNLAWRFEDWRNVPTHEQQPRLQSLLESDRRQGFDLQKAPLMRLVLLQIADEQHELVWSIHHALVDGWSMALLVDEFSESYQALRRGATPAPPHRRPYRDYIAWLGQQDVAKAEAFWRKRLEHLSSPTALPLESSRGKVQQAFADEHRFELTEAQTEALRMFARDYRLTQNTVVQGAWALLLSRYSGQEDVVFGATFSGRTPELADVESSVGLFINTLPVRIQVPREMPAVPWLLQVQSEQLELLQYQYSSLAQVQGWSAVPGGMPLFETILVFENYPVDTAKSGSIGNLSIGGIEVVERTNYPLTVIAVPGSKLSFRVAYDPRRVDSATLRQMMRHFQTILEAMVTVADRPLSAIPMVGAVEREQLLDLWNRSEPGAEPNVCVHELFQAQATRIPDAIAVTFEHEQVTYRELQARASELADRLITAGVGPDVLVGLCVERSVEMVVGILGILEAGGAYVPLDPSHPQERLGFMIEDANLRVIVTQDRLTSQLAPHGRELIRVEPEGEVPLQQRQEVPRTRVAAHNTAYVIYTSGSTGSPKGVLVSHANVVRLFRATDAWFQFSERDVWTLFHSYGFDFSVWELFGALLYGGRLVVVPFLVSRAPEAFCELLKRERVTVLNQTPSAFGQLIPAEAQQLSPGDLALRLVIFGGEALGVEMLRPWFMRHGDRVPQLVNMYGITETTVHVTYRPLGSEDLDEGRSVIGRPIPDLQVYLLDEQLEPAPVGLPGEIYVGGAGVAQGYLNRPELTAARFIRNPFLDGPNARLYRSGDLARQLPNGDVEYLGRIDNQVKIRGFRVELGEIEAVLDQQPGVRRSVVTFRDDPTQHTRLVAYVQPSGNSSPAVQDLRKATRSRLPEYMVPSAFVLVEEFPLTGNGKVDRRALPPPDLTETSLGSRDRVAPRTPVEQTLAEIWSQVLGLRLDSIGVDDNLFDLGGHSLIATQLVARIRHALQVELPLRSIFELPTIARLAAEIEVPRQPTADAPRPVVAVGRDRPLPLSVAQEQLWFLDQLQPGLNAYNAHEALRLRGPLDIAALDHSFRAIVRRHESLRTTFKAVYGAPVQVINPGGEIGLSVIDLMDGCEAEREHRAESLLAQEIARPFDLETGPLARATLLRLNHEDHILLLTVHHAVWDAWSASVFFRELTTLYGGEIAGRPAALPALPVQYADYAQWQRDWIGSPGFEAQLAYWRQRLAGAAPVLQLPTDRPRPPVRSFDGSKQSMTISREVTQRLKALGQREGVTLFMSLLAVFQVQLCRYTNQADIVVGTDVANRDRLETEGLIGFFVENVIIRTDLSGDPTFRQLLGRVRDVALGAFAHQGVPFGTLVGALRPDRNLAHTPLFQVLFVLQNAPSAAVQLPGVVATSIDLEDRRSKFDLALFMTERAEGLVGTWVYRTDLFDTTTVREACGHFETLLEGAIRQPDARLSQLAMHTEAERSQRIMAESEREQAALSKLRGAKRRAVNLAEVSTVKTTMLRAGDTLPLVIQPDSSDINLNEWAAGNKEMIETSLLKHGALLFRGFGLRSLDDFERFVESICPELFDEYGDLPREGASGKIYKSTPYPADRPILFHNESSHMHHWPRKIWFHCVTPAREGGETPIVDCREIYRRLDPRLRDRFAEKGLMYVRNYTEGLDVSWEDFFQTSNRSAVESYCRKAGIAYEWKGESGLRTKQLCPAVVKHPKTGEITFFNQIQLHHVSCLEPAVRESLSAMFSEEDLPRNVYYGDGSAIEDSVVQEILDLYWQTSVAPPWQRGDVIMLDNMLIAHARNPFAGERKIVVAMGELVNKHDVETLEVHA